MEQLDSVFRENFTPQMQTNWQQMGLESSNLDQAGKRLDMGAVTIHLMTASDNPQILNPTQSPHMCSISSTTQGHSSNFSVYRHFYSSDPTCPWLTKSPIEMTLFLFQWADEPVAFSFLQLGWWTSRARHLKRPVLFSDFLSNSDAEKYHQNIHRRPPI